MKFTVKKTTVAKQQPTLDVAATEAALVESYESMSAAYESLVAIGGEISECAKVMDDCKTAMESIQKFGVTAAAMDLFNGENHNLDKALGLESLAVESIASLSKDAKEMLKANYTAGLENKFTDAMKAFGQMLAKWWNNFLRWVKELFDGNAKLIRLVEAVKFPKFDDKAEVTAITYENAGKIEAQIGLLKKSLSAEYRDQAAEEGASFGSEEVREHVAKIITKEKNTVAKLGWDAGKATAFAKKFVALAKDQSLANGFNQMKKDYAAAKAAAAGDKEKLAAAREKFSHLQLRGKLLAMHTKMVRALGTSLLALSKVKGAEEKKAAKK